MGREVRKVPAGWEHPKQVCPHSPWAGGCSDARRNGGKCYLPVFEEDFVTDGERTHYQVYETVSEGTPMSPVFATKEELIEWLVNDGGQDGPHSRKAAEAFVKNEWAPSMVIGPNGASTDIDVYDKDLS